MSSEKKICLIIPPSPFLLDERVFYFIGILNVAAHWERRGYKIDVLDLSGVSNYLDVVDDYFASQKDILFVGITATSPQYPNAHAIASKIKPYRHKLVLGGTHATLSHTSFKRELKAGTVNGRASEAVNAILSIFDILFAGDGEYGLDAILNTSSGIIDGDDRNSPFFLKDADLDNSPFAARHLIDLSSYQYFIDGYRATNVIFQRFCPFACHFCGGRYSPSLRSKRNVSIERSIKELEFLYKEYGFRGFNILDDELNVNKDMIKFMYAIADLQDRLGVDFKLRGFTKAELLTDEQCKAMYTAGFRILLTGFESGDPRILENINKKATREDNTRCVELAKKNGLKVKALLSMGHPGESYETIENTKNWVLSMKPEFFDMTVISNYPGSPYYDDAIKTDSCYVYTTPKTGDKQYQKEIDYTKEANYYKGVNGSYVSYVWTDFLSPQELVAARDSFEEEVRKKLNIPYDVANPSEKYEHSMGQGNILPDWVLRSSQPQNQEKRIVKLNVIQEV